MTIELPQGYEPHELPADYDGPLFIEGQMQAYAHTCVNAALEQAAQECGAVETELGATDSDYSDGGWSDIARHCAERVRLLKTKEQK